MKKIARCDFVVYSVFIAVLIIGSNIFIALNYKHCPDNEIFERTTTITTTDQIQYKTDGTSNTSSFHTREEKEEQNNTHIDKQYGNRTINEDLQQGLVVDWWYDICMKRTVDEQLWHPLFPRIPQYTNITLSTGDKDRHIGSHFRRIYGYLYTSEEGKYDFLLESRDGAEMILTEYETLHSKGADEEKLFHIKLTADLMNYQDPKIPLTKMFFTEIHGITMKGNRLYFLEIIQAGRFFSKYRLQWRKNGRQMYKVIQKENLLHSLNMSSINTPSLLVIKTKLSQKYKIESNEARRLAFHQIPTLNSNLDSSILCTDQIIQNKTNVTYLYQGISEYTDHILVYPKEFLSYIGILKLEYVLLPEKKANSIAWNLFEKINQHHNNTLELANIVHVISNVDKKYKDFNNWQRTFYFVELDVKKVGQNQVYRISHFAKLDNSKPKENPHVCFMNNFIIRNDVKINIITPIRNQRVWLTYLVEMLENLVKETNESNVNLILIDNNSTDADYKKILQESRLQHRYLNMSIDSFSKVKALNHGIKHVEDANSIIFVLDLHLQLPANIFDRIRKLTIQGKTALSPTLMKLACGEHEQFTDLTYSEWLDAGTGMMAMYKSDWDSIGGFNEKLFGSKWGGEDWEVIDRIVSKLYLIHIRMPRFYHIHHSREKMWDKDKQ